MIDHILGRPSASWKRTQIVLVMIFWIWRLINGNRNGPRLYLLRRLNRALQRFTPWQIAVTMFTLLYAGRHLDSILGLGSPEPLARLYSRAYYRATWITTGLDAGFATAMTIQPKWLRDLCSVLFSAYYIVYANEADEKLRKYRAVCTVEMLRTTWEKTNNPYLRLFSFWDRPRIGCVKKIILPRPSGSTSARPVVAWLFFDGDMKALLRAKDLIIDLPGGGFICMSPLHHEERLRRWAICCKRPVLSIDYGKAPEYPYPYAIEECFDVYRLMVETKGTCIGMSGKELNVIMAGDSAGGNLVATVMYKILESPVPLPRPVALVFSYAALDFNFTSWMSPTHLRVLRQESSSNIAGVAQQKDHFSHKSPLAVIDDTDDSAGRRHKSWLSLSSGGGQLSPTLARTRSMFKRKSNPFVAAMAKEENGEADDAGNVADVEDGNALEDGDALDEQDKPLERRVVFTEEDVERRQHRELTEAAAGQMHAVKRAGIGTRLTMTSRTGYFQDRIISPSMMRAMAILYIGPKRNPDFETDYYISPIRGPSRLLAEFPPMLMTCGEKDPFVDDTVIFAGRVREAKRARRMELAREPGRVSGREGRERARLLEEKEEDWVRMGVIEGWSHGYLQMSVLMPEAREAICRIGEWMRDAFEGAARRRREAEAEAEGNGMAASSGTETDEGLTFVTKKRRRSGSAGRRDGGRSSDETLVGGGRVGYGDGRGGDGPGTRGPGLVAGRGRTGERATLVSEADLLKRRREEAVYGIGNVSPHHN